jgi:NAD(P)-dependent dehydrogenase (short-subunit alcohol dehydrogenase family)
MTGKPLLQDKVAAVYGAGTIGAAVARAFAAEGAEVFVSGHNKGPVADVVGGITSSGGRAHAAVVDALDDKAVNQYVDGIVKQAGKIDVTFSAVGPRLSEYGNNGPAVDLSIDHFMVPMLTVVKSQFITARAAARHMVKQKSGAIIFLTGSPARGHGHWGTSAIGTAFGAIETLMETFSFEVGPMGVRSVCLRITANSDSRTMQDLAGAMNLLPDQGAKRLADMNVLKVPSKVIDTGNVAAFLASDQARFFTSTVVNTCAGAAPD